MVALASVGGETPPSLPSSKTYYIAADEVEWDFMPAGKNLCGDDGHGASGASRMRGDTLHAESERAGGSQGLAGRGYNGWEDNGIEPEFSLYTDAHAHPHRIGTKYVMALFREYEDDSFTILRHGFNSRANGPSAHLGIQGPVLRLVPGESITIVVYNRLRHPCNFAIPGVGSAGGLADERPLLPGERRVLVYSLAEENNLPGDQTSVALPYASDYRAAVAGMAAHVAAGFNSFPMLASFADANAGLFGSLIVARDRNSAHSDLAPSEVNREFVLFMGILDQNLSPYLDMNIAQFAAAPETVDKNNPDFKESNRMHAINGRVYCNLEGLEIMSGRKARWYVFSGGADEAFAAPRWYGTSALVHGSRMGSILVQPGTSVAADILHDNQGSWLLQDQTSNHAYAGATARFTVVRKIVALCEMAIWTKC